MNYLLFGSLAAYLVLGAVLTWSILAGPTRRLGLRDVVLGPVFMPILTFFLLLFILFEDLWARLLIALDFDPPEEMRAGPAEPARPDSGADDAKS